jgi:hypothetical protein
MRSEAVETWYNGLVEAAKLTVLTTKHIDLDMVLGH